MRQRFGGRRACWVIGVTASLIASAGAQAPQVDKLGAPDALRRDELGSSVALHADVCVLGSPGNDEFGTDAGAAYVYRLVGGSWAFEQKLFAGDAADGDGFGGAVAVDGDFIVVGARGADAVGDGSGAVYVYEFDGLAWSQTEKLVPSDAAAGDAFGAAVDLDGEALIASAHLADSAVNDSGAAYVFRRNSLLGWLEEQKLSPSVVSTRQSFGISVALSGDRVAVGASGDDELAPDAGACYTFSRSGNTWSLDQKLLPSVVENSASFGAAVDLAGELLVVGAPGLDDGGRDRGAISVRRRGPVEWIEEDWISNPDPEDLDSFGRCVATDGLRAVVGCEADDALGRDAGAVYSVVSRAGRWAVDQKYAASDSLAFDEVGCSVALDGDRALAGALGHDDPEDGAGAGYLFHVGAFRTTAEPDSVAPGEPLTIQVSYGDAGSPVALYTAEVDGVVFKIPLILFVFAADHQFTVSTPTPSGLSGLDLGLFAFRFDPFGKIEQSTQANVFFE